MASYIASWDTAHYGLNKKRGNVENHTLAWFNADRGYGKEHIAKIKNLRLGEGVEIEKGHIVIRKS
jgi:hypothetical protein